uniref:Uncharacterized protein n=1 Tax=Anguilla anguilla TaxID=7936 RepID=A0A0E9UL33_ANGAN
MTGVPLTHQHTHYNSPVTLRKV